MRTSSHPRNRTRLAAPHQPPSPILSHSRGFSLIEVLGVMMIMAILLTALMPSVIRELDREARSRESRTVERLVDGLLQYVVRTRTVPAADALELAIATQLGIHTNDVLYNSRGLRRIFLVDPDITNRLTVPYAQTHLGNTNTLGNTLGIVVLSSVGAPLPAELNSGFATNTQSFQAIWSANENQIPIGFPWTGSGEDLCIQRINLAPLFVPLVLNYDVPNQAQINEGRFTIDASATNTLPTLPVWVSSYIKGTVLGLHDQIGTTNSLQAREVLQHPMSYIFQNNVWRSSLLLGPTLVTLPSGTDLQAASEVFVGAPLNSTAQGNPQTTLEETLVDMTSFMTNYIAWADEGFSTNSSTYAQVQESQQLLDDVTEDLLHRPEVPDNDNDEDGEGYGESVHDECTQEEHAQGLCHDDYGGHGTCDHHGVHWPDGSCHHADGSDCEECYHASEDPAPTPTPCSHDSSCSSPEHDTNCPHHPDYTQPTQPNQPECNHQSTCQSNTHHSDCPKQPTPGTGGSQCNHTSNCSSSSHDSNCPRKTPSPGGSSGSGCKPKKVKKNNGCGGSNNNGHGNNWDGVDSSNPGQGGGGPNGQVDPSGDYDDERR